MFKIRILLAALIIGLPASVRIAAADDKKDTPKYTIKQVMKEAHGEDGLRKKLQDGKATQEDKTSWSSCTLPWPLASRRRATSPCGRIRPRQSSSPPKAVAADKDGSPKLVGTLTKATACKACHEVFK